MIKLLVKTLRDFFSKGHQVVRHTVLHLRELFLAIKITRFAQLLLTLKNF